MHSLKKLKMKKVKDLLATKEEVRQVRASLEKKTASAYEEFARAKKETQELSHQKYLD